MDIVRLLHSWVRWLVLIVAVVNLLYFALGWLQARSYNGMAQKLARAFSGVTGLQWLLGLILLVVLGSQTGFGVRHYWEHLVVMTLAVALSNLPAMLRRRDLSDKQRYLAGLITVLVVLALVIVGISALPEGIRWRFFTPA